MNRLPLATRAAVIRGLVEGSSIRSAVRMTGATKGAILRLIAEVGELCTIYQDHKLRNLPCKLIDADEIWGYCNAKEKNATKAGQGDLWTYIEMDPLPLQALGLPSGSGVAYYSRIRSPREKSERECALAHSYAVCYTVRAKHRDAARCSGGSVFEYVPDVHFVRSNARGIRSGARRTAAP